jgi:hypothetical protein
MVQGENKRTYLTFVFRNREIRSFKNRQTGKGWLRSEQLLIINISIRNFLQDGKYGNRGCSADK